VAASERAYIALGSNLGDRAEHLAAARAALAALPGTRILAASEVEETAPLAGMDQPPYLNQMVLLETSLDPRALRAACLAIE
jgi:2-amino-4-hydroxy-6-hydroxymethyldihydropteridine diphosphokinase